MEKEFIPYEQALELKELGFDEPCFGYHYTLNGENWEFAEKSKYYSLDDEINIGGNFTLAAPLYQQAFRFFREKYGLWFRPDYYDELKEYDFQGNIHELGKYSAIADIGNHKTPEEAELACLKKLIELVKKEK